MSGVIIPPEYEQLFDDFHDLYPNEIPLDDRVLQLRYMHSGALHAELYRSFFPNRNSIDETKERVIDFLESHPRTWLPVQEIARSCGVSLFVVWEAVRLRRELTLQRGDGRKGSPKEVYCIPLVETERVPIPVE